MSTDFDVLPHLYNKVQLDDGSIGVVRYIGSIMGKKGTFYGIDVTKGSSKNDGTFKGIRYFDTKRGGRTGRFCKSSKIKRCKRTSFSKYGVLIYFDTASLHFHFDNVFVIKRIQIKRHCVMHKDKLQRHCQICWVSELGQRRQSILWSRIAEKKGDMQWYT